MSAPSRKSVGRCSRSRPLSLYSLYRVRCSTQPQLFDSRIVSRNMSWSFGFLSAPLRASEALSDHYTSRSSSPTVISTAADTFYRQLQYSTALTSTIPSPDASVILDNADFEADAVVQLLQTIHSLAAISVMYCGICHIPMLPIV